MKTATLIAMIIILMPISCGMEDENDAHDHDSAIDDDDDQADDDDSTDPSPYTYDNLEFVNVPLESGEIRKFDLALNSEGQAGICVYEWDADTENTLELAYWYETEDGEFQREEVPTDFHGENECAILFDEQDHPVIASNIPHGQNAMETKVWRMESNGSWTDWDSIFQTGKASFISAEVVDEIPYFVMDSDDQPILFIENEQVKTIDTQVAVPLFMGDAVWACGNASTIGGEWDLTHSLVDTDGNSQSSLVEKFEVEIAENKNSAIGVLPNCEPRVIVSVDENPPMKSQGKKWAPEISLRLYKETEEDSWTYTYIAEDNPSVAFDMMIDEMDSIYAVFSMKQTEYSVDNALLLAVGTWNDFDFVPLLDEVTPFSDIKMRADKQNQLHFLFNSDSGMTLLYGRPAKK